MNPFETVFHYHETTKHHPYRYAKSSGYLDWATQPDPFRTFAGAAALALNLFECRTKPTYDALFDSSRIPSRAIDRSSISSLLQFSLGISAWKEFQGSRWALRINPSSGNLHPTEGYVCVDAVDGLTDDPGVYHYCPKEHKLERRCVITHQVWQELMRGFPEDTFLVGLSSVHWREAWKYGERAFRYCQHDVGHAIASVAFSAAINGWSCHAFAGVTDEEIESLLGLNRLEDFVEAEPEHPDILLAIMPTGGIDKRDQSAPLNSEAIHAIHKATWTGKANTLSDSHVDWEIIDQVAEATRVTERAEGKCQTKCDLISGVTVDDRQLWAASIIQQRRSAVDMDGQTSLTAPQFHLMLERTMPNASCVPWGVLDGRVNVDLLLMVHRVDGLAPGLYYLVRNPEHLLSLKSATRSEFQWVRPADCPESLPLYALMEGDVRNLAQQVSCGQSIAGNGAFSLGMIAHFEVPIQEHGPGYYRKLFWETGVIGQVLYLEAEAAGVRATGIGCFFDGLVHEILGITDTQYQSLYHFTVGGAIDDPRLTTLPAYPDMVISE